MLGYRDGKKRGTYLMHREMFKIYYGDIPSGMVVMHTCDNPACIEPEHLKLGTVADNNRDCRNKGRNAKGETHGNTRLSKANIADIRRRGENGDVHQRIADDYGVSRRHVSRIIKGEVWTR